MWIKLDFTPLFIGGLLVGLVLVAIGLAIRSYFPAKPAAGILIIVAGAIPVLVCTIALVGEPLAKEADKRRNQTVTEQLTEDREIQGIRLPHGTKVERLDKLMSGVWLTEPLTVLGLPLEGHLKFTITLTDRNKHVATDLETATLATDRVIDGVPCQAHHEVEFFRARGEDPERGRIPQAKVGKLKRCTPSEAFDFAGNRYAAQGEVTLNGFDGVEQGILATDQDVDGHWCRQGTEVQRPERQAIRFTLARAETVNGIACKAGTQVAIEPEKGRVTSAILAHDQEIGGIPCRGGEEVGFAYGDGSYPLDSCILSRPITKLSLPWPAGARLRGMSMSWLEVTLPPGDGSVTIGEVKIVGRCKIGLGESPLELKDVTAVEGAVGYAEFRGVRYTDMSIYQGSGWGHLAEPATLDGIGYDAGANVRFQLGVPK